MLCFSCPHLCLAEGRHRGLRSWDHQTGGPHSWSDCRPLMLHLAEPRSRWPWLPWLPWLTYVTYVTWPWSSECGTQDTGFTIIDFHSLRCLWNLWCNMCKTMWVMLDVLTQLFGHETSGNFYWHMIWEAPARVNSGGASFSKPGCPGCCAGLGGSSHWRVGALWVSRSPTKDIPETALCSFAKSNLTIHTFWNTKLDKIQMHHEKYPYQALSSLSHPVVLVDS